MCKPKQGGGVFDQALTAQIIIFMLTPCRHTQTQIDPPKQTCFIQTNIQHEIAEEGMSKSSKADREKNLRGGTKQRHQKFSGRVVVLRGLGILDVARQRSKPVRRMERMRKSTLSDTRASSACARPLCTKSCPGRCACRDPPIAKACLVLPSLCALVSVLPPAENVVYVELGAVD